MNTPSNDITELRSALFETLKGLRADTCTPEKARAINETCQVIINSAKLEVDFLRASNGRIGGTGFVPALELPSPPPAPDSNGRTETPTGYKTVLGDTTIHRMR